MNDLDDLKSLMDANTPKPDLARKAENTALAMANFDLLQGSASAARPTSSNPIWTGVKTMLTTLTSRGGLTVTTALVACGFLVLTPAGQRIMDGANAPGGLTASREVPEV